MEVTIHVRIGEGGEVLGGILLLEAHVLIPLEWLHLVELLLLLWQPQLLRLP